ncbi:MAG: hypothetical protein AW07_00550 [Candidatus Accumulibacter sp. SK-11]|nr:MAG: hypothetical protein AW07_00550 [Candidatus Accumulibacter sp. SK-11]
MRRVVESEFVKQAMKRLSCSVARRYLAAPVLMRRVLTPWRLASPPAGDGFRSASQAV